MSQSVYDAMGGAAAVHALAFHWHRRVLADPVVSHAFGHGFRADQTARLAAYWAEQLGGPHSYTDGMGGDHSEVVRLHSGNGEHHEMDRRAEVCFAQAVEDAGLPADPRLRATLEAWFHWGVGLMDSYPERAADVPRDLPMALWTWDGPASS